jgi:hypothetical protein
VDPGRRTGHRLRHQYRTSQDSALIFFRTKKELNQNSDLNC